MTRPSAFATLGVKITSAAKLKGSVNFTMNHATAMQLVDISHQSLISHGAGTSDGQLLHLFLI
jgi:hypothetical protein